MKTLRGIVGSQAKIYVRPIQRDLPLNVELDIEVNELKETCTVCKMQLSIGDLRSHVKMCRTDNELEIASDTMTQSDFNQSEKVDIGEIDTSSQTAPVIPVNEDSEQTLPVQLTEGGSIETTSQAITVITVNEDSGQTLPIHLTEGGSFVVISDQATETTVAPSDSSSVSDVVVTCVNFCRQQTISNPVEILKLFQKEIVTGRKLEIESEDTILEGNTNFIMVNRDDIIESGFSEINSYDDLRPCMEVQFSGEVLYLVILRNFYFTLPALSVCMSVMSSWERYFVSS